jgi:ankyrin repeat protein
MASAPSPILDALYHGRRDEADRLAAELGSGALSIHEAAALGVVPRIETLLAENPAAVNAWASDGFQPLGLACFFGRRDAASLLLARGGDLNLPSRNSQRVMALHAALAGPTPDIARSLIDAGADVNAVQQDGVTPLMEAAAIGNLDLVQVLLAHGADPSARDGQQRDAAAFARRGGHTTVVDLLEKG